MQERMLLQCDELYTDKFFATNELHDTDLSQLINFPLPTSAETLQDFMLSSQGQAFRDGAELLIDHIHAFMGDESILYNEAVTAFKSAYLNNKAEDAGVNITIFALLQEGVLYLAGIWQLLQQEHIAKPMRQDAVRNLLTQLQVCGPGVYTHISNVYLKLKSYCDVTREFQQFRFEALQQLIDEIIRKINRLISGGMPIHYVNAMVNYYAPILNIPLINDAFISCCDPDVLSYLYDTLNVRIRHVINAENLLEKVIDELNLEAWVSTLKLALQSGKMTAFNDTVQAFETQLARYGTGDFSVYEVCTLRDDNLIDLAPGATPILFLNLLQRMQASGFFHTNLHQCLLSLEDGQIDYIPLHTLKFAYVVKDGRKQAFLPFYLNAILEDDPAWESIWKEINLHPKMAEEVNLYVIQYLRSNEFKINPPPFEKIMFLVHLMDDGYQWNWREYYAGLPAPYANYYLQLILCEKLEKPALQEVVNFFERERYVEKNSVIEILLGKYPFAHSIDRRKRTILHIMCLFDCPHVVRMLLDQGVDPCLTDTYGLTPLMYACNHKNVRVVDVFLEKKIDPSITNDLGVSALHIACRQGSKEIVIKLLAAGCSPNVPTRAGMTPLLYACRERHPDLVRELLKHQPDLEAKNQDDISVLSMAVRSGLWPVVQDILLAGAKLDLDKEDSKRLLIMLKAQHYPDLTLTILRKLISRYQLDLEDRSRRVRTDLPQGLTDELAQVVYHAKAVSAHQLLSLVYHEQQYPSPRRLQGVQKSSWDTACITSRRMSLFAETYEALVDQGVLQEVVSKTVK